MRSAVRVRGARFCVRDEIAENGQAGLFTSSGYRRSPFHFRNLANNLPDRKCGASRTERWVLLIFRPRYNRHIQVKEKFQAALDALVDQVKRDKSILAAILCGSLSHDT